MADYLAEDSHGPNIQGNRSEPEHISWNSLQYTSGITQKVYEITGVAISSATVCRLLGRHGFTRKKVKQVALQEPLLLTCYCIHERCLYGWMRQGQIGEMLIECMGTPSEAKEQKFTD